MHVHWLDWLKITSLEVGSFKRSIIKLLYQLFFPLTVFDPLPAPLAPFRNGSAVSTSLGDMDIS